MNQVKQLLRYGYNKYIYKELNLKNLKRTRGLLAFQDSKEKKENYFIPLAISVHNWKNNKRFLKLTRSENLQDYRGLIDIAKSSQYEKENNQKEFGDFAQVDQESFVHALSFSKADIEMGNFSLSDINTVVSQVVDDFSSVSVPDKIENSSLINHESNLV